MRCVLFCYNFGVKIVNKYRKKLAAGLVYLYND